MSGLQIFSNSSFIPPDVIQHKSSVVRPRPFLKSQSFVLPAAQQMRRLRFDQ